MAEHYVLCVLSQINVGRAESKKYAFKQNGKTRATFDGYQTNEAPVECLIKLALDGGNPITGIICLVSEECKRPITTGDGISCTSESHFKDAIASYYDGCKELAGKNNPAHQKGFFIDVPYKADNPAQNLRAIVEVLDKEDVLIDFDTTGGPRDAAFLLTNVVQFIEAKHRVRDRAQSTASHAYGLGKTVYANLSTQDIYLQGDTFEISKLIYAINAFTEYGKANPLASYFNALQIKSATGESIRELCAAMQDFSDDLSLCRTQYMNENVDWIHKALDDFEGKMRERMRQYDTVKSELDALENEDSSDVASVKQRIAGALSQGTAVPVATTADPRWSGLKGFKQAGMDSALEACKSIDDIRDYLQKKRDSYSENRSLILFLTLTASLREGIPGPVKSNASGPEKARQTIEIIRWCVERDMLQQALALFKERVPECLEQLSMLDWGECVPYKQHGKSVSEQKANRVLQLASFPKKRERQTDSYDDGMPFVLKDDALRDAFSQFVNAYRSFTRNREFPFPREIKQVDKWVVFCQAKPTLAANPMFLRVKDEEHLRAALVWYDIVNTIRNNVMHVNEDEGTSISQRMDAHRYMYADTSVITCTYDEQGRPEALKKDLLQALRAVEGKVVLRLKRPVERALNKALR